MVPEDSELYYENGTLLPFLFEPEWDRYGGRELLELSLDFFAVSSVEALEAIGQPRWRSPGHRGALAFRLLLRQAAGFAVNSKELLSHLGYCLPVAQEIADEIWAKADRDFETHREIHGNLVRHELLSLATAAEVAGGTVRPYVSFLHEAAKRLSQAVRGVPPATRWQIGHSQLHMTANRLGFSPFQEMHLQRILWLAARDLEKGHPITGERIPERFPESGNTAGPSLSRLADSAIDRLRMADRFANAVA
jgi:thiopeptide-type bacteriocin biosynthesis protein